MPRTRHGNPQVPTFCHCYRGNDLVLCRCPEATAVRREKRYSLGKNASYLTKRAASHQQSIRLNHALQSIVDVWTHVEDDRLPNRVERAWPYWAACIAHSFLRAVIGYLRRQAPWILGTRVEGR